MRIELQPGGAPLISGHRRIAARVQYRRPGWRAEQLWFDLPESMATTDPGDGWFTALLPLAFHLGEPLHIEADVDPVLLDNAVGLQELWLRWYPQCRPVPIEAGRRRAGPAVEPGGNTLLFSGGIDSFYSLLVYDELARAAGTAPLDDLVHVWGYDLPLSNRRAFERKSRRFEDVAARSGKRLLTVATNLRHTRLDTLSWPLIMHGPALAAPVLMLNPSPRVVLLSASGPRPDPEPYGSHPAGDRFWSTSRTSFVHYALEPERHVKTARVARSRLALEHLHVCWLGESDRNCGRCLKCCLTQIALDLAGRLAQAQTFDPSRFSLERIHTLRPNSPGGYGLMMDLGAEAQRLGRPEIVAATDRFREYNRQGALPPPQSWWTRTWLKWRRSARKRRSDFGRLVREWGT